MVKRACRAGWPLTTLAASSHNCVRTVRMTAAVVHFGADWSGVGLDYHVMRSRENQVSHSIVVRPIRLGVSLLAVAGLLTGCAQGPLSTRSARIGTDDGSDSCRTQVVALDSTGNFFGADILKGAAVGAVGGALFGGLIGRDWRGALVGAAAGGALGAAAGYWGAVQQQSRDQASMSAQVRGDLANENAQIDRTQLAFDQVNECRFGQARTIQADYTARRIDRATATARMADVRERAQRELALARQINGQIASRGAQFEVAAENLSPGARTAIASGTAPRTTTVRQTAALRVSPSASAAEIGRLEPRQTVTVGGSRNGFAQVETASGERGYAPVEAIQGSVRRAAAAGSDDVRVLAGSNASRRDDFAQSVAVSERAAATGFELTT